MSDVMEDLQLMLDQPSFLDKVDYLQLSQTGLEMELNTTLFGRDRDLKSLQDAFMRAAFGSSLELGVISGVSGTGKSTIANCLGEYVTANGGYVLSAKFDQMIGVRQFSEVASALNNFCEILTQEDERDCAMLVASRLRAALGQDVYCLAQILPSLHKILKDDGSCPSDSDPNYLNAQRRNHYLLSQFVEVMCSCSKGPILLLLDDVQWVDPDSISLINHILLTYSSASKDGGRQGLFFLGCCRHDEMEGDHLFWQMINSVCSSGSGCFNETHIELSCMDSDEVNGVLSNLLHLTPRLVRSLSEILYHKTSGNPLFLTRMLLSLNREGLLLINMATHRWEWDEEAIHSQKLPDDVAEFFIHGISRLPDSASMALRTLSCFGAAVGSEVIDIIDESLGMNLAESLGSVIKEGLLSERNGMYTFSHDRIQETAYAMMEESDRCRKHMKYGLVLADAAVRIGNDALLLTAVTQMNIGGPQAVREEHYYSIIAEYNLNAGKKSMDYSDFASAFRFFDQGSKL